MVNPGTTIPPEVRFWRKVQKGGPDECWIWLGGKMGKGYGQFMLGKMDGRTTWIGAHRFSWMLHNGMEVPKGQQVMHACDNPPCVNPAHLSVGSCADNALDKSVKGRNPGNQTKGRPELRKWPRSVIAAMRAEGMTYREIGDALSIAPSTAYRAMHPD